MLNGHFGSCRNVTLGHGAGSGGSAAVIQQSVVAEFGDFVFAEFAEDRDVGLWDVFGGEAPVPDPELCAAFAYVVDGWVGAGCVVFDEGDPNDFVGSALEVVTAGGVRGEGMAGVFEDAGGGVEGGEEEFALAVLSDVAVGV